MRNAPDYGQRASELHRLLRGQFHPLHQALLELRLRLHRASSLVENFNSRLRNYFFLRRQIGARYLDLARAFSSTIIPSSAVSSPSGSAKPRPNS